MSILLDVYCSPFYGNDNMLKTTLSILLTCMINIGALLSQSVDGGVISFANGDTLLLNCTSQPLLPQDVILLEVAGENSTWVVTNEDSMILEIVDFPPFDPNQYAIDPIFITHVSYDSISKLEIGLHINQLEGVFDLSNSLSILSTNIMGNVLSLANVDTIYECANEDDPIRFTFNVDTIIGDSLLLIITDENQQIFGIQDSLIVSNQQLRIPYISFTALTYSGNIDRLTIGGSTADIEGCYAFSNTINIQQDLIDGGTISLDNGSSARTLCVGDGQADTFSPLVEGNVGPESDWIIVDSSGIMLAIVDFNTFNLEGVGPGQNSIYHISYSDIEGLDRLGHIDSLSGCFDLSNPIVIDRISGDPNGGSIHVNGDEFCVRNESRDSLVVELTGSEGDSSLFLMTNTFGMIAGIFEENIIVIDSSYKEVDYFLFNISFVDGTKGIEGGKFVEDVEGCYDLSNGIPIKVDYVAPISYVDQMQPAIICADDGLVDLFTPMIDATTNNFQWIILQKDTIRSIQDGPVIDLDINANDTSYLIAITYNTLPFGLQESNHINELNGCYELSTPKLILNSNDILPLDSIELLNPIDTVCIVEDSSYIIDLVNFMVDDQNHLLLKNLDGQIIQSTPKSFLDVRDKDDGQYFIQAVRINRFEDIPANGKSINEIEGCFQVSNEIEITIVNLKAAFISKSNVVQDTICIVDDIKLDLEINSSNGVGPFSSYLVTDINDSILVISQEPIITIDSTIPSPLFITQIISSRPIASSQDLSNFAACQTLSNSIRYDIIKLSVGDLSVNGEMVDLDYCPLIEGDTLHLQSTSLSSSLSYYQISSPDGDVLDTTTSNVLLASAYALDTLYIEKIVNDSTDFCRSSSNQVGIFFSRPIGGSMELNGVDSILNLCQVEGDSLFINPILLDEKGENTTYILTAEDSILQVSTTPSIRIDTFGLDSLQLVAMTSFDNITLEVGDNFQLEGCSALSNTINIVIDRLSNGTISSYADTIWQCRGDANIDISLDGGMGTFGYFIVSNQDTVVLLADSIDSLDISLLDTGQYSIKSVFSSASLDSSIIGDVETSLGPCYVVSNSIVLNIIELPTQPLRLAVDSFEIACEEEILRQMYHSSPDSVELFVLLDTLDQIVAITTDGIFTVENDQVYRVIGLNMLGTQQDINVNQGLDEIKGCYQISDIVTHEPVLIQAYELSSNEPSGVDQLCQIGPGQLPYSPQINGTVFGNNLWYITDTMGIVQDTFHQLPLMLNNNGPKVLRVYNVSYLDGTILPDNDSLISNIKGCYTISNFIEVEVYQVIGGTLTANNSDTVSICSGDLQVDDIDLSLGGSRGELSAWLIVNEDIITSINVNAPNNFFNIPPGICQLYHIRYSPIGVDGLFIGNKLDALNGCFDLSNPVTLEKQTVSGGRLVLDNGRNEVTVCVDDGIIERILPILSDTIGSNHQWIITNEIGEIQSVDLDPPYSFEGGQQGQNFIWNIAFENGTAGVDTNLFISNIEGCHALSNPVRVRKVTGAACLTLLENQDISLDVYPNPTTGYLNIVSNESVARILLTNMHGERVEFTPDHNRNISIDMSPFVSGIYVIEIYVHDKIHRKKVIKI